MNANRYEYIYYRRYSDLGISSQTEVTTATRPTTYFALNKGIYTAVEGETFRSIARTHLGSEQLWWLLADINYKIPLYEGAFGLPAGALIEIPFNA